MGRSLFIVAVVFELFYTEDLHYDSQIERLQTCCHSCLHLDHVGSIRRRALVTSMANRCSRSRRCRRLRPPRSPSSRAACLSLRVSADLRVEERKRPRKDVVCRGNVEPVFHALSATSSRVPVRRDMPIFVSLDRSGRVRRPADAEERQIDAVEPVLVVSECRQDRLPEIRHVADRRLDPRYRR